jgi:ubiquinone/menaquinone biosynthesis C-methylase UbiE
MELESDNISQLRDVLRCPTCKGELSYVDGRQFRCETHGAFACIGQFPSFSASNDFDEHWQHNESADIPEEKVTAARSFLAPLIGQKSPDGLSILDVGCGDGVHASIIKGIRLGINSIYTGVDISVAALQIARRRMDANARYVHADAGELPFADNTFDVVFSYGVLAYTEDPFAAFTELARVTKPGGLIGVWFFPYTPGLAGLAFSTVRRICRLTGRLGTRLTADAIVPFLGFLPTASGLSLKNATWKQCREIVLVNIAPKSIFFPRAAEIDDWFRHHRLADVPCDTAASITAWGRKPLS